MRNAGFFRLSVLLCMIMMFPTLHAVDNGSSALRVIFDTDMGNDVDDALALAMLHSFESRGELKVLAVTLTKDNPWASPYVNLVNTFYGRGDIPVGAVRNGKTPEDSKMIRMPAQMKREDGAPLYPRSLQDGTHASEATALLRRILAAQEDGAITIIQVGFSTNLARLLDTPGDVANPLAGEELVARKVRTLFMMAGDFAGGKAEYNIKTDLLSAQKLFNQWPTPIVVSGFEVGNSILYPARSIENDFKYTAHHPIVDAYRAYMKMPYNRPTWDLTAVLAAVRPDRDYFSLSPAGRITVTPDGKTEFAPSATGKHRYLKVDTTQRARVLEAFLYLVTQPPAHSTR